MESAFSVFIKILLSLGLVTLTACRSVRPSSTINYDISGGITCYAVTCQSGTEVVKCSENLTQDTCRVCPAGKYQVEDNITSHDFLPCYPVDCLPDVQRAVQYGSPSPSNPPVCECDTTKDWYQDGVIKENCKHRICRRHEKLLLNGECVCKDGLKKNIDGACVWNVSKEENIVTTDRLISTTSLPSTSSIQHSSTRPPNIESTQEEIHSAVNESHTAPKGSQTNLPVSSTDPSSSTSGLDLGLASSTVQTVKNHEDSTSPKSAIVTSNNPEGKVNNDGFPTNIVVICAIVTVLAMVFGIILYFHRNRQTSYQQCSNNNSDAQDPVTNININAHNVQFGKTNVIMPPGQIEDANQEGSSLLDQTAE